MSFAAKKVIHAETRFGSATRRAKRSARSLQGLFKDDLAKSGIRHKKAKRYGLTLLDSDGLWDALNPRHAGKRPRHFTAEGYTIQYYQPDGQRMRFIRARKLRGNWRKDDDDRQRYSQPQNTPPHLYIPPRSVLALPAPDPRTGKIKLVGEVLVTEGEKKALAACLAGITAFALGGVWNAASEKYDVPLLEEFKSFDLTEADLVICFDTDLFGNTQVEAALRRFAYSVRRDMQPRSVKRIQLMGPQASGKVALDDWLAAFKDAATAKANWQTLVRQEDRVGEAFAVFDAEVVYVALQKRFYDVQRGVYFPSKNAVVEHHGVGAKVASLDGKKQVHAISLWLDLRGPASMVHDVVYAPGKAERYRAHASHKEDVLNRWRPSTLQAIKFEKDNPQHAEAIAPFLEYFEYLTASLTAEQRHWFLCWLAYPLQNVGRKMTTAVLAVSEANGVGKGLLHNGIMRHIYGDAPNARMIKGSSLISNFNSYVLCQFLNVDEVHAPTYTERAAVMSDLKTTITEPTLDVEEKFLPRRNVDNYCHVYMTSNHPNDALQLDPDDRRFFVFAAPSAEEKWPGERFKEFGEYLEGGSAADMHGVALIYGYLKAYPLQGFDPRGVQPKTDAWRRMVKGKDGALGDLVKLLWEKPEQIIGLPGADGLPDEDLYEPEHLVECLLKYAQKNAIRYSGELNVNRLGALTKGKIPKRTFEAKRNGRRTSVTLYAILNRKRWKSRSDAKWKEYWAHFAGHKDKVIARKRSRRRKA